jgi:O-antigen ligase
MRALAQMTAATATTAAFAKIFLPFYLVGSTPIFVVSSAMGVTLVVISWRPLCSLAGKITGFLLLLGGLYLLVIFNFLVLSRAIVPITYLVGILVFHALFLIFGFATARALNVLLLMLLGAAATYVIFITQYAVRFGELEQAGYLRDIFGVGNWALFITFYPNIGLVFGLAALAALGLSPNRTCNILLIAALPILLLFLFYISARAAIVAVVFSLAFWISADLWQRSKRLALVGIATVALVLALTSGMFYHYALHDKNFDPIAGDAISRTIREIQERKSSERMQIWERAWNRISNEPNNLLFGRGIGVYPIHEDFDAPDWLLHPTEGSKHYPHEVYLEMLYETGIVGFLLFGILTVMPVTRLLRRWSVLTSPEKSAVAIYVFVLLNASVSGAFAYTYILQFFLAITLGINALRTTDKTNAFI